MDADKTYEKEGFVLRRRLLSSDTVACLLAIGERVHAQWLQEHAEEAHKHDLINSSGLTATRYFQPPFDSERRIFFDALADNALWDLLTAVFGDDLYFHGTQMFFNPLGGRRPYWHRDLQYMSYDESRQRMLLGELCNLHVRIPLRSERDFMLVPGSHARWDTDLEREVRLEGSGHHSWEELPSATTLDLDPGDTLIFSAHMLHRGTYDGNNSRLSLDLMLGKPHAAMLMTLDLQELPTAGEFGALRHPQWFARARKLLLESPKSLT
jgi:ectoine hydroxylase-related dioxygenase (phytanoyl-CoA dioxygenase family)